MIFIVDTVQQNYRTDVTKWERYTCWVCVQKTENKSPKVTLPRLKTPEIRKANIQKTEIQTPKTKKKQKS